MVDEPVAHATENTTSETAAAAGADDEEVDPLALGDGEQPGGGRVVIDQEAPVRDARGPQRVCPTSLEVAPKIDTPRAKRVEAEIS
jgi:hypothetical protein